MFFHRLTLPATFIFCLFFSFFSLILLCWCLFLPLLACISKSMSREWRTLALYQLLYSKVIMNYGLVFPCSTILVFVFVFSLEFLDKEESPWGPTTNCGSYFPASLLPLPQLQLGEWHLNISEIRSLYKLI